MHTESANMTKLKYTFNLICFDEKSKIQSLWTLALVLLTKHDVRIHMSKS